MITCESWLKSQASSLEEPTASDSKEYDRRYDERPEMLTLYLQQVHNKCNTFTLWDIDYQIGNTLRNHIILGFYQNLLNSVKIHL